MTENFNYSLQFLVFNHQPKSQIFLVMYENRKTLELQTMATLLNMKHVETDLIMTHTKLIRALETKYALYLPITKAKKYDFE